MIRKPSRLEQEVGKGQLVLFGLVEEVKPRQEEPVRESSSPVEPEQFELPDLEWCFIDLNQRYFKGLLDARVEWSNRLTAASGKCNITKRIIRISVRHYQKRPQLLQATMAHEMLHLIIPDHGKDFRLLGTWIAGQLGVTYEEFRYAERWADMTRYRYLYACPACGAELVSKKRRAVSCGRCSGGRFDERFRMALAESRARPGPVLLGERPVKSG